MSEADIELIVTTDCGAFDEFIERAKQELAAVQEGRDEGSLTEDAGA